MGSDLKINNIIIDEIWPLDLSGLKILKSIVYWKILNYKYNLNAKDIIITIF